MQRFFKSKEFKKLERLWQKKLSESGFVDAEDQKRRLKKYCIQQPNLTKASIRKNQTAKSAFILEELRKQKTQDYYSLAGEFLESYSFKCVMDKLVWEFNCEGLSMRRIAKKISESCRPMSKSSASRVICRLNQEMERFFRDGNGHD